MTEARRWFAAAALAALSTLAGCSGDDGGSNIGDGGNEQLPPPSLPDETIGHEQAPALVTTPPSDTFLDGIVSDGAVTADELESAYHGYIDCMSAAGISGVYAWDVSLDIGVVVDGLTIDGDDPEGTRLRSAQADCARDYLGDLRRRYDEANPQHPADLRARRRASLVACVEAVNPAIAASVPDDITTDTEVDGVSSGELQLDPTLIGASGDDLLPVERCLGSMGAPYHAF